MRPIVLTVLVLAALLQTNVVRADDTPVVAVLPLRATGRGMAIYSKPVADAIAKRLKRDLGVRVESLPTSGTIPAHVGLVVDGRIVAAGKRRVLLEARVRDPALGRAGTSVVTKVGALSRIDELAAQLATTLAPVVRRALAAQKRRVALAKTRATKTSPKPPHELPAGAKSAPSRPRRAVATTDARPAMVVFTPTGRAGDVPIAPIMWRAARRIASGAGHRMVRSNITGVQPGEPAVKEIRRAHARYALMIHISHVSFRWHGPILSARGRVRVVVVNSRGRRVYDRTARTGTLVGSRGDRHEPLLRLVAEQIVDIATPQIKRALAQ